MKTKQTKEEQDKSLDEDTVIEPKTRARKKASDIIEEEKKTSQDEPKTSKEAKKPVGKPKAVVKKRPLGIRKTLRSKQHAKALAAKDKGKNVIKQTVKRGRKTALKPDTENLEESLNKILKTVPLIPASEIKKEPVDETSPNSRSSSPKTAGRRQRVSSDMAMMKTMLGDSPGSLVLGPRTSPYSMRSERSNSPSLFEGKNLRSGKPRKVKNNLLSEVVMKEQKKRRRLHSDSKTSDTADTPEDCKKMKRGRSCSRDGSEISKCSDNTESDLSMSETLNDTDNSKELNKKLDKSKTDLDIDIENNVQISTIEKVPSLNIDSKLAETKLDAEPSSNTNAKDKKKLSLKRSTSLDSDNNNSNRVKLENLNTAEIEEKLLSKTDLTDPETLFKARSSILTSMSKTFNSKEMSKNIRKARRGRKVGAGMTRPAARLAAAKSVTPAAVTATSTPTSTITTDEVATADTAENPDTAPETIDTLTKEINDLINNLDQNIDGDHEMDADTSTTTDSISDQLQTKTASKFYGLAKPLNNGDNLPAPETPIKDKDTIPISNDNTPSKSDDSENIRLHYEEDPVEKPVDGKHEIKYKCTPVGIDKLMDRLKEFEEFDKRRQLESKAVDGKPVMVTNDVVLIPKSGDIKPLKDIQSVRSPEKPLEKENVLSCFENNSAISIVKRDQVRKSLDVDLPNSVTLIKRNSFSSRKESTSSNHSADAISIFEKSLGKDVTLTEIRKSVDKTPSARELPPHQVELHPYATLHPNPPQSLVGGLDSCQITITPRIVESILTNDGQVITKRKSRESLSRKSSESTIDTDDKMAMATIEKIKSPPVHQNVSPAVSATSAPVAIKSPEVTPVETEALPPPVESIKAVEDTAETKVESAKVTEPKKDEEDDKEVVTPLTVVEQIEPVVPPEEKVEVEVEKMEIDEKQQEKTEEKPEEATDIKEDVEEPKPEPVEVKPEEIRPLKSPRPKSARNSIESQPGPSNAFNETPESQKRKENVLRTLGLLTHKAAKEAKIEKLKEKERIYGSNLFMNKNKAKSSGGESSGTLKTVIKLNRGGDKKKHRSSLKMTFQKSKYRSGKPTPEVGEAPVEDDAYYTIERREGAAGAACDGGHRKTHYSNRLNSHDPEAAPEPVEPKETLNLVIPEKASSFSIHPGRLCMDQCFYCGGKFGLYDTPCHIAQIKSSARQKKVLDNEEKLTIDSCLCDACYRHVDRRANCPSYRKRPLGKQPLAAGEQPMQTSPTHIQSEKPASPPLEEDSEDEPQAPGTGAAGRVSLCHTEACTVAADHSIRRKWLIKMRSSVNKLLKLKCDYPGLHTIPLCGEHYRCLAPLMACVLCRRRLTKHHNVHFIHHGYLELNPHLSAAGIPVQFTERPVLCKGCRYYCTLLQRPGHNDPFAKTHRRKLLQAYNIEVPPSSENETEEVQEDGKLKKKQRAKSKQRNSTEPDNSESSERTNDSTPEKDKQKDNESDKEPPIEEDIESLISSNRILVPNAKSGESAPHSDGSEAEAMDMEAPILPIDKQTELQYLLQKQNNPAQFLPKPNLTQKQRNILKIQNMPGIQKPGQHHRINEKNAKRIHKLGQIVVHKEKTRKEEIIDEVMKDGMPILKNITLNDECTIESIPNKRPADINTLKNKWQMSESFSQVKKNLSELSKNKDHKKISEVKYSNPVKRLETNPSISVRELFPGEEEMNLQCNIEFNNVKGVTPEGWEKCNTLIQYDVETKKLWNELQRPYGNQSSFLRHLILLEKYFRSGDLVLSHNASPHAANYSDSVQSRLRAYDNVVNDTPRRSEPAISLIEFRKKPSMNGKSLLKSNQNDTEKDHKKFMPPPGALPKAKSKAEKAKSKPLPPELIAINTPNAQGRKAIQNVLHNIQQLVKGVSASDPTEIAAAPLPATVVTAKLDPPPKEKKDTPKKDETPKKTKTTSKPWRPTLMPITPENLAKIAREPTQVAVDGRTLPSLVQVMSAGKRFHITLQDYNKMCIMRREKLQQLQDGEKTKRQSTDETTVVTEIQPSTMLGNGGTVVQNISPEDKKEAAELGQIGTNAATILKNVGLKNITIAPIPPKTATVTSQTVASPVVSSPSLLVTSTPIKIPQLGPAVSIVSETVLSPPVISSHNMIMPKIPKSLTVIPQTVMATGQVSSPASPAVDNPRP
ncbi:enhanced adult sensory threshold isoform X2 [Anticarsia gemmatalis]|uniref:enhanced adult sensory threshold isoform X2 n=1 Tax=Anticarsia gemmatalis TaxID=129554 RepID=UPI003F76F832